MGAASTAAATGAASLRFWSDRLDVADCDLARAAVFLGIEGHLLTFVESAHAGAFQGRCMDEYVLAAIVPLNEAEALLTVVELYGARVHGDILSLA